MPGHDTGQIQPGDVCSSSQRVLIVEDHVDSAESMSMLLQMRGHEVAIVHNGEGALAKAKEFRPHVVLCDIGLPGTMDGYAVARALSAEADLSSVRLIALTGYGRDEDIHRARQAGFETFLVKPVDFDKLTEAVAI